MSKRISPHLQRFRSGIADDGERDRIIEHEIWIRRLRSLLEEARAADHDAYVQVRQQTSVFDLIEAEGERMIHALTVRGNFKREEITLPINRRSMNL
jgi:hypothetical protein